MGYGDVATCEDRIVFNCVEAFKAPGNTTKPSDVDACVAALPGATCDELLGNNLPAVCDFPAGTKMNTEGCAEDFQCQSSNCVVPANASCGACQAKSATGGACSEDGNCEKGLVCNNQVCATPVMMGGACAADKPCLATLTCMNGTCQPPLALGDACTPVMQNQPQPCNVLKGEFCGFSSKCEAIKVADAGQSCGFSLMNGLTLCKGTSSCEGAQGSQMCVAKAADGAACNVMNGPECLTPAKCLNAVCTVSDPQTCP